MSLGLLALSLLSSSCASGALADAMVPAVETMESCEALETLSRSIQLGRVSGGSETSSWDIPQVSDASLREALERMLAGAGLLGAEGEATRRLEVQLVELTQPQHGATMEVIAFLRFRLFDLADDNTSFDDVISASCTLDMDDAFLGVKRLRLASEGAVRANLGVFLQALCAQVQKGDLRAR